MAFESLIETGSHESSHHSVSSSTDLRSLKSLQSKSKDFLPLEHFLKSQTLSKGLAAKGK